MSWDDLKLTDTLKITVYGSYLVFQLISHKNLYHEDHKDVAKSVKYGEDHPEKKAKASSSPTSAENGNVDVESAVVANEQTDEEPEEEPQMSLFMTVILLIVITTVTNISRNQPQIDIADERFPFL